jgi:hypothetical protein
MSEHEIEPIPGLPEYLPKGERILWQGAPHWRPLAWRAFRLREVMIYFAALMTWRMASKLWDGATVLASLDHALALAPLALGATAILVLIAFASARTSMYTITDRRIVLRVGMALPVNLNIPFDSIEGVDFAAHKDGSGDLALRIRQGERLGYAVLWPHARPWRYSRPEPMLRGLADPQAAAKILAGALAGHAQPAMAAEAATSPDLRGAPAPAHS